MFAGLGLWEVSWEKARRGKGRSMWARSTEGTGDGISDRCVPTAPPNLSTTGPWARTELFRERERVAGQSRKNAS